MRFLGGLPFEDDGRLRVKAAATASAWVGGWGVEVANNAVSYEALGAGAVPAGSFFLGGLAFAATGKLFTTVNTAGGDAFRDGHRIRQDGALVVEAASPGSNDPDLGGWSHAQDNGAALISVIP